MQKLKQMPGVYRDNYYLLCVHVDISVRTLDNWMKYTIECKSSIPIDKAYKIAEFFNCTPDELINRYDG
ncbi:helix-turn-helix domain-containing protein [Pseudopedobacter beijingensis]|uniref:Helix-turn-helix domain-containing protein n=1 Tax=Pseudopedobacter beijingensis TaxID=1207056 RepID=A0ABW4IIU8_9SPHI